MTWRVIDGDGRPVCSEMWPGNTADVTTLIPVIERLRRRFAIARVCVVADRGLISAETTGRARGTLRRSNEVGAHVAWAAAPPRLASVAPDAEGQKKTGRSRRTGLRSPGAIASKGGHRCFVL